MDESTSIEILDTFLLKFLNLKKNNYKASIAVFTDWNLKNISIAEIYMVLAKLIKDGYVRHNEKVIPESNILLSADYILTFEGKLFIESGGYVKEQETNAKNESRKDFRERQLLYGTWAVAFGAISLVLWEMYKTFYLEK